MATLDNIRPESTKLTISEAEAVTGVTRAHINRILDDGNFANIWRIKRHSGRRLLNLNHCAFVRFHEDAGRLLAPKARKDVWRKYVVKLQAMPHDFRSSTEDQDRLLVILGNGVFVDMTRYYLDVLRSWEALARSRTAIVTDPEVRGGIPVIGGTRISAHEVAGVVARAGVDEVLAIYPSLDAEKVEAAVVYAKAHPRVGRPPNKEASRSNKAILKSSNVVRRKSA